MQQGQHNSALYATMRPASGGKSLVTLSTYQERQEALKRTTMMEDDVNHRKSRNFSAAAAAPIIDVTDNATHNGQAMHLPPPPPPFANNTSSQPHKSAPALYKTLQPPRNHSAAAAQRPPSSPVPDYDNVQLRTTMPRPVAAGYRSSELLPAHSNNAPPVAANSRHTMRLGMVTIGQYEHQRKEPAKFDFIGTTKRNNNNGNNSHSGNGSNGHGNDAEHEASLHSELQNTLSRSNLKRSNGPVEHQRNCPLTQAASEVQTAKTYANIELATQRMAHASLANGGEPAAAMLKTNGSNSGTGTGILKNGRSNRSSSGGSGSGSITKPIEKSIKFGN